MVKARFIGGGDFESQIGKVVCVGRNYAEHARELNNPVPTTPILFIKPSTAVVDMRGPLVIPEGDVHYETEIALLIGKPLKNATPQEARSAVIGVGLALDLTRRDLQSALKEKGLPWEIAKCFDGACPLSDFVSVTAEDDLADLNFSMYLNGELRQDGKASDMITAIAPLLAYMSSHFTLMPGDVALTGTPAGVGRLQSGDRVELSLSLGLDIATSVA
ncbi:fumarylacetoacetate hydrolase family protein [Hahella sp. KA22]|uniref:fumarylacetoacetate hydrolase family protein n=1 Tax=Hahella sp. KA22 TaxID=1628392 RepID=UPI000FDD802D|nr:fumarylacetoacetate hydrolase family protein [Hahella sp. KA22]AZZ93784.1 fumarylacetoacetate hydrolase family protein [Hahella sp. KA22]QAY57157.1 fumarylacetoacetate hydrolase family protein [Hahella sp. KA22]